MAKARYAAPTPPPYQPFPISRQRAEGDMRRAGVNRRPTGLDWRRAGGRRASSRSGPAARPGRPRPTCLTGGVQDRPAAAPRNLPTPHREMANARYAAPTPPPYQPFPISRQRAEGDLRRAGGRRASSRSGTGVEPQADRRRGEGGTRSSSRRETGCEQEGDRLRAGGRRASGRSEPAPPGRAHPTVGPRTTTTPEPAGSGVVERRLVRSGEQRRPVHP